MREIKFRCWNNKAKTFYPDNHFALRADGVWLQAMRNFTEYAPNQGDMVFMQYTGKKDNTGKEIYEGDIVNVYLADEYVDEPEVELEDAEWNKRNAFICQDTITWSESGGFFLDTSESLEYNSCIGDEAIVVEIIGNIFENSELLAV